MKAFVIYLPSKEHSVLSANNTLQSLKDFGIDAELFAGTPGNIAVQEAEKSQRTALPYSIKNYPISQGELQSLIQPDKWETFINDYIYKIFKRELLTEEELKKVSRPGVIGCFFSHYKLWQQCVDLGEPIMIFEDDVKFYRGWEPVIWEDVLILCLGKTSYLNSPYKEYLESPTGSPQALSWSNFSMPGTVGYAIKPHAAKALLKSYRNYFSPSDNAMNQHICKIQIHNYIMGRTTTVDEGNISMVTSKSVW